MSRYFDALNRLRKGRETAPQPDLRLAGQDEPGVGDLYDEPATGPGLSFPELQLASRQASYGALLDLLRARSKDSATPAVIIAGVSGREPVSEVVTGIELQAQRQGVVLKRGSLDLATGARILHLTSRGPFRESTSRTSASEKKSLRLSGSQGLEALANWLDEAAADCDLLLIEAPALATSVEGALLAGACQGLVLVGEALVTERAALLQGIERARLAGGEILGLVLTGTKRWLPRWMERLLALFGRS